MAGVLWTICVIHCPNTIAKTPARKEKRMFFSAKKNRCIEQKVVLLKKMCSLPDRMLTLHCLHNHLSYLSCRKKKKLIFLLVYITLNIHYFKRMQTDFYFQKQIYLTIVTDIKKKPTRIPPAASGLWWVQVKM